MEQLAFDNMQPLDREATAKNVKEFFKFKLNSYQRIAGYKKIDLSSPALTGMPVNHSNLNGQEKTMMHAVKQMEFAQSVLYASGYAYQCCDKTSQQILKYGYQKHLSDAQLAVKFGYGIRSITKFKIEACCQFAEALSTARIKFDCLQLQDLREFKKCVNGA